MTAEWDAYRRECARAWLRDVRHTISKMRAVQNELRAEAELYDMMKGIAYDPDGASVVRLHGDDSIAEHIIRIQRTVERLSTLDIEYHEKVAEARDALARLKCHPYATEIMTDHYVCGWTWERIADDVGYAVKRIEQISAAATLECYELMPIGWRVRIPRAND